MVLAAALRPVALNERLASYDKAGCIVHDHASNAYIDELLARYFPQEKGQFSIDKVPLDPAKTNVYVLACDPDQVFKVHLAEYEEGSNTLFIEQRLIDNALRSRSSPLDTFATFFVLHELGHRESARQRQREHPKFYSTRDDEERADAFAIETFAARSGLPSKQLLEAVINVVEGPLMTDLTQAGSMSPVQITATHPAILVRSTQLYEDLLRTSSLDPDDRAVLEKLADQLRLLDWNLAKLHYATIFLPPGAIAGAGVECGNSVWILSTDQILYTVMDVELIHNSLALPSSVHARRHGSGADPFKVDLRCESGRVIAFSRTDHHARCLAGCEASEDSDRNEAVVGGDLTWDESAGKLTIGSGLVLDGGPLVADHASPEEIFKYRSGAVVVGVDHATASTHVYWLRLDDKQPSLRKVLAAQPPDNIEPAVATDDGRYVFVSSRTDDLPLGVRVEDGVVIHLKSPLDASWSLGGLSILRYPGVVAAAIGQTDGELKFWDTYMSATQVMFATSTNDLVVGIPASRTLLVLGPEPSDRPY
ncbi:MAG: hypothetical protein JO257_21355 [Deltaproteobacteria bacterium]|nr:hypothetical protein [Deltaproteobacteria bacterium]